MFSPNVIHHYQVFSSEESRAFYFLAPPTLTGAYTDQLLTWQPENPVIPAESVHPDIPYALRRLYESAGQSPDSQKQPAASVPLPGIYPDYPGKIPPLSLRFRKERNSRGMILSMISSFTWPDIHRGKHLPDKDGGRSGIQPLRPVPSLFPYLSYKFQRISERPAPESGSEPARKFRRLHNRTGNGGRIYKHADI